MKLSLLKLNRSAFLALVAAGCAGFLASCAMTPEALNSPSVFKFTVLQYKEPVPVANWHIDPSQAINSDGEALNVATAITHGNVDQWLATWEASERPTLTADDRAKLVQQWASLKNGRESVLGHVVAGGDLVIEISIVDAQSKTQKLKVPLKRVDGVWYQTRMEADNEYLHWETSPNKIVQSISSEALQSYLVGVKASPVAHN